MLEAIAINLLPALWGIGVWALFILSRGRAGLEHPDDPAITTLTHILKHKQ